MRKSPPLKSPFPYPGGKSKVADMVWSRLGNCENFCEPFAGSAAVLLRRPAEHFKNGYRVETLNDANHFLVNLWRALKHDPDGVAEHADWPVMEADLHARHRWLMHSDTAAEWKAKMASDPEHYDAKIAGWWVWGACCWIGSGWCEEQRASSQQIVLLSAEHDIGQGVNSGGNRLTEGRPQLTDAFDIGRGVNGGGGLPVGGAHLGVIGPHFDVAGRGVHGLPNLGTCDARRAWLVDWMRLLSDRLRLVRTCYGHWSRICNSDSTLTRLGTTGVFLDPPYPTHSTNGKKSRADGLYANDKGQDLNALRDEVLAWCDKWGKDKAIRIAVCGYEGDGYEKLEAQGWTVESWEASGGYGNQAKGKKGKAENAKRERIWFSPGCISQDAGLFTGWTEVAE